VVFQLYAGCAKPSDNVGPPPVNTSGTAGSGSEHAGNGGAAGEDHGGARGGDSGGAGEGGADDPGPRPPCTITAPTSCPEPWPVYADIEPVLAEHCLTCHLGLPEGPWPLTSYSHVAAWRDELRAELLTCGMPPPEEAPPLPESDSLLLLTWIRCGMPP
jgi:hypothetical protein